jgi:hypothetical protein
MLLSPVHPVTFVETSHTSQSFAGLRMPFA